MFALADAGRLRRILGEAGFSDIAITPNDPVMASGPADRAAEFAMQMGPLTRALADSTPEQRQVAEAAVLAALRAHEGTTGLRLTGGVWLVSARA
jgi:hypothetical protein